MPEDKSLNDLYEKVGALSASHSAMRDDIKEIKDDGKAALKEIAKLNWTVAKWSGGLAVLATIVVNFAKDLIHWK